MGCPSIYIVTAASAVNILFPNTFTKWWFRNRKYIGMTFAVAMGWQGAFIYIMSTFYRDYYQDVWSAAHEIEGSIGHFSSSHGCDFFQVWWWYKLIFLMENYSQKRGLFPMGLRLHRILVGAIIMRTRFFWNIFISLVLPLCFTYICVGKKRTRSSSKPNLFLSMTGYSLIVFGFIVACTGPTWGARHKYLAFTKIQRLRIMASILAF